MILIIEDEPAMGAALRAVARRLGYDSLLCFSGREGIARAEEMEPKLVILDIGLPDGSGIRILETFRRTMPQVPVLMITAHGTLQNAVEARRLGASGYLVKPFDLEEVQETIDQLLHTETASIPKLPETPALMVGTAPAMQRCFVQVANACASDVPVLITGPTGGGKTLAARVIHNNSLRRTGPFVSLHCNALPETLMESELFGHEKNAFTGATAMKLGHIERARGGTLFLDEIADVSAGTQAKLLRFVEERVYTRVGGREELSVDLRIICATNRDLREEVRQGRFREDLFYRLHVLSVEIPALRDHAEDIPAISAVFLGARKEPCQLSSGALDLLCRYPWPGNVRELRNSLEHATTVSTGGTILPRHLPPEIRAYFQKETEGGKGNLPEALNRWLDQHLAAGSSYDELHRHLERLILTHLLSRFENKPTVMARVLNLNRVTLRSKMRQCGLLPAETDEMV